MGWFVYMLECSDRSLYTGITNDLERRIASHNGKDKRGSRYARSRAPVRVVYVEKKRTRSAALVREAAIKRLTRQSKLTLIRDAHNP